MRKIILESNGVPYCTKKQLAEKCREIMSKEGAIKGADESFLLELLKRHPHYKEKTGAGIVNFGRAFGFGNGYFIINRKDGSHTDFSWTACLHGANKRKDVFGALRAAIAYQINNFLDSEFKDRQLIVCPLTGENVTRRSCHVDHVPPSTFQNLAETWLSLNRMTLDDLEIISALDGLGHVLKNQDNIRGWQAYHLKNAVLRVVSSFGNLSTAKKH